MESGPYVDPAGAMLRHQARMERLKQVTNPPPVQAPQHGGISLGHALTGTAGALAAGALAAKLIPHPVAQGAGLGMQALAATLPHVASIGGMMAGPALVDAVAPGLHEAIDRNAAPIGGAALIGAPLALMALRRRAPAVTPTPPGGAIPVGEMFGPARPSMGGLAPFGAGPRPQANPQTGPQVVRPTPFTPSAASPIMEGELVERAALPGIRGFLTGPRGFLTGPKPAVEAAVPVASAAVPTAVMRPAEITGGPYRAMRSVKLPGATVLRSGRASTISPPAIGDMTPRYEVAPPAAPVEMTPAMQSILGGIPPRGAGLASESPAVPGIGGMLNPLKKKVAVAPVTADIVAPQMRLTKAERPPMRIAELQSALRGVGVTPETAPSLSAADLPTLARKAAEAFNATSRASGARLLTKDEYGYLKEAAHKMSQAPMEHSRVRPAGLVMAEKQSLAEPSPMSKLRTIPEEELAAVPERFEGTRQELFGALAKNIDRQLKLETDPKKRLRIVKHLLIGEKPDIKAAIHEHLGTIAPDVQSRLKMRLKSATAPAPAPATEPGAAPTVKQPTDEGVVEQTAGLKPEATTRPHDMDLFDTELEWARNRGAPDPATAAEFLDRSRAWIKEKYPDVDSEIAEAQAQMHLNDAISSNAWKPAELRGKLEVGQTVRVGDVVGNYRGTFEKDGKKYAVIASEKGGQFSVPANEVADGGVHSGSKITSIQQPAPAPAAPALSREEAADRVFAAMGQFRDADQGALVTAKELRAATGLDKATFDTAVSDLAKSGKVMPHKHDFATSLKPEDRDQLVDSAIGSPERVDLHANEGRYWVGFAKRREQEVPAIKTELDALAAEQKAESLERSGNHAEASTIRDSIKAFDEATPPPQGFAQREQAIRDREKELRSIERSEKNVASKGPWLPPAIKSELQQRNQMRRERLEAPAPKIGDNLRIADVDGTLADTETIGGVRYEIYNSWRLKDNRAVVRVVDEGTGNTIHVKQYPAWDAAKQEFDESVRKAQGLSKEEPHAVGQVGQQGVGREEHPGGNAGGEAVRPGTGDRVVGAGPGAGQAGHQSPVEEATTSGHVAASWTTMPPEAVSGFEKNVLAPLREQVQHLEGIENRVGQRYAWETAAKNGVKPGDPHAGSSGLERWKAAATKAGLNADALVAANPEYQALVNKLNGYRGWGDEPVASLKASSAAKTASGVLSPDDVLGLIKESPNHKGASTDWSKFAEQYGVNEPFHRVQLPVRQLAELANRGTMHMSRTDQSAVDAKSQSGRYNPVVIGTPKSGENTGASGKPLAVLDGNHSLAAAAKNSDETIDAIVSESAAKFLGIKPASPQEVTGFNVTAARAAMDRRGIAEHGDTNVRATPVGDGFHVEVHTRAGGIGWNRDVLPERYATLEAAQDAAINELQRRSAGNAVAQQAAPAESAIPAHAPEAVAAPAPSPDIPAYKRTTLSAEQNAAAREQRHERHGELYRQLRSLEDQYSAKSREADRTPRSHNKKRAKLQAEADDLGKQVAALRNQERTLTRESNLELIEDQLEKPRSYEHYLKLMTELHDLQRQHHHEMVNTTAKMRELGPTLAKSAEEKAAFHQQESDRHALELLDRIKAKVPTDKLNADEIQSVAEDVYRDLSHRSDLESQIAQSVQRRLEHRTAYGKTDIDKMAHLDDAAKSGFKAELDKAVERGPDWFERSKEILARAKSADDAGAEVAAKERAEAAKRAAAEADVRAVEAAQENRQRNRTMMLEPQYFANAKERGNALKGKIQKVNEGSIAAEREGVLEREVLSPTWTIDKVLAKDDKGNLKPEFQLKLTAPGQEPVVAMTSGNAANLRQLVVMLEDQGVDMRKYAGKATPDDVQAKWKQTVRAWENDSFGDVDDEFRDTALKNAGATPTNVKADLVLDRADLGYGHTGTHIANATINSTLKPLAEEVPEFGYNPVFTVSNDKRLVFRDHYKYEFAPEAFNLHPNELKPGQTVGINLDDLGIDRSTPEKVVAGMLTNAGWSNVKSGKNGITASAKPGAAPTTFTGSGETWTASGPDASSGQGLLDEIRWTQPGQDAPARTHAGVRIPQKTEPVLELTEPNATTEQMRASRVTLPNPMEAKPAPAVERLTAKPKNMAGKTREAKPAAERPPLPEKSVEMMTAAIESKDVGKLQQMLDPSNKSWRAMFEERTGVKLPRTIRDTKAAIEKWAAPEPPKKLSAREPKPEPEPAPQIERLTGKSFGETVKLHRSGGLDGKTARYAALAEHLNAGGAKTDKAELLRLYDQKKISQIGDADTPEQIRVHLEQASDVPAKERARWQRDLAAPKTGRGASSVESQGKTAKEARNRLEIAAFDMERRADILRSIGSTKADGLRELAQKLRSDINENESQFGEALRAHAETMKAVSAAEESSRQWKPESNSAVHLTPKGLAEEYEHPRWSMSRTLAETGYYTNGKFMLKMPEKLKEQVLAAGGGVKEGRGPDVAAILGQVKNAEREPMRAIGERTIPSFDENGNQLHAQHETIVRDASGNSLIVDSTYLRTVFRSYPDATLHAIPKGQAMAGDAIVVKNDGDIVGVIMGRNRDGLSPEDKAYLKSAPSDVEMKAAPKIKRLSPASGNAPRRVVMSRGAKKLEQRQADAAERAANPASLADVMSGGKAVAPKIERLEGKAEPWRKDATHLTKESLPQAVEALTGEMLDANPKLSENRAKELAAARIRHAIHEKVAEMEKRIRSGTLTPEEEKWYDAIHVDKWSPTRDLERLTGSRTMISDADDPIASLPLSAKIPSGGGLRFPNPYGDSPAGKSYVAAKTEHPDSLVLLRQQNTYELFGDDAKSAAKALGLTLSYLDKNSKNPIAMVGFSQQLLDAYKQKLVAAGHRVAIVEAAR